jgi:hypothetical protein
VRLRDRDDFYRLAVTAALDRRLEPVTHRT